MIDADKLAIPRLIHTNTSDEGVNVLEVEHLIAALKAAGKKLAYRVFDKAPGGHGFDRMDTPEARKIRADIYAFLARHLKPPRPQQRAREEITGAQRELAPAGAGVNPR